MSFDDAIGVVPSSEVATIASLREGALGVEKRSGIGHADKVEADLFRAGNDA